MNWGIPEGRTSLATEHNMDELPEDLTGRLFCGAWAKHTTDVRAIWRECLVREMDMENAWEA
jgi:hypothetical protein